MHSRESLRDGETAETRAWMPPYSAGATLSGWPSMSAASWRIVSSPQHATWWPASTRPASSPPMMAALDEPSPRANGMRLSAVYLSGGTSTR